MKLRDSLAENNSILLQAEASTWQEAVKLSVDLLVKADVVEPRYYQAILDGVAQHGPYFVIAPGLAMPHGRPEEGVKKTGFALVTLKTPLVFNHEDNDPVDILITMAAVDANTTRRWASCRLLTCLMMKLILTVYAPAVPRRTCWI